MKLKTSLASATILLLTVSFSPQLAQEQNARPEIRAQRSEVSVGPAREVVLGDLPRAVLTVGPPRELPHHPDPWELAGRETGDQESVSAFPGEPSPSVSSVAPAPETTSALLSFKGEDESACGGYIPSDHALATSSSYVVQVLNSCITVYNTTGRVLSGPTPLSTFLLAAENDVVGDVRAMYDWSNNRFIVLAVDFTSNHILLGASATSNPIGTWYIYSLDPTSGGETAGTAASPMMGQTEQENGDGKGGIYISFDRWIGKSFVDDVIWILPKSGLYAGANFTFGGFYDLQVDGVTVDHVQPANVMGKQDRPRAELLVNTFDFNNPGSPYCNNSNRTCQGLAIWAIYNGVPPQGKEASLTGQVINTTYSYKQPVAAAQPGSATGTPCALYTGNNGISGTVTWSAGDLYLAATTRASGQASDGFIYWQVHPYLDANGTLKTAHPPVIRNEVCWGCSGFKNSSGVADPSYSEYYPTVQPDDEGNATIVFNYSSSKTYPSVGYISLRTTQAPGSFPDPGLALANGLAHYCQLDNSRTFNLWADDTATSPFGTPIAGYPQFWFAGAYSESNGNWGTRIAKSGYTSGTQQ